MMDKEIQQFLKKNIDQVKRQLEYIEKRIQQILEEHYKEMRQVVLSVPGIGKKAAAVLIVLSDGFRKFKTHKQLAAFVGLSPRIYQWGSSVKGKSKICKMGMSRIRALLYVCAWSAKKYNVACKELYERLVLKGKSKRLALIAVANKLIKQVFAIATTNTMYDSNYKKISTAIKLV